MSRFTIEFHDTEMTGRFGVIYKDDVEVWRDKPWPDDGSAEEAAYRKVRELEEADNPLITSEAKEREITGGDLGPAAEQMLRDAGFENITGVLKKVMDESAPLTPAQEKRAEATAEYMRSVLGSSRVGDHRKPARITKSLIIPPPRTEEGTRLKELIGKTLGAPVKGTIPIERLHIDYAALERACLKTAAPKPMPRRTAHVMVRDVATGESMMWNVPQQLYDWIEEMQRRPPGEVTIKVRRQNDDKLYIERTGPAEDAKSSFADIEEDP